MIQYPKTGGQKFEARNPWGRGGTLPTVHYVIVKTKPEVVCHKSKISKNYDLKLYLKNLLCF